MNKLDQITEIAKRAEFVRIILSPPRGTTASEITFTEKLNDAIREYQKGPSCGTTKAEWLEWRRQRDLDLYGF